MTAMFRRLLVLLGCTLGAWAAALEPALIGIGEPWSFLPATNEPPAGWAEPGFSDQGWRRGDSGFGSSNRGENTVLFGFARGSGTLYFRKEFAVADPADVGALMLRADWQGGFVAYLNGTEMVRRNLGPPGAPLTYTNLAEWRPAGWAEDIVLTNFAAVLRPGTNVLAIRSHVPNRVGYDVVLVPELLANFQRGPYVQCPAPETLNVLWRTPVRGPAVVEFGPTPELGSVAPAQNTTNYAFASLTGVAPGSRVFYRVKVNGEGGAVMSPTYDFRTAPRDGPVSVLMFGDSGTGSRAQFEVARQLNRLAGGADAFLHLGDIIYPWFHGPQTDTRCLSVYRPVLRSMPNFFTWGNHDLIFGPSHFLAAFRLPTNNIPALEHLEDGTTPEFYYSFDVGDAHFAVVYWPWNYLYAMQPDSPQARWLDADLAGSEKRWKFMCLHHPLNTSSAHRFDDYDLDGVADRLQVEAALMPLAAKHGVRLVLSGHDHAFERFHPVSRVTTVVTGGGGAGLYGVTQMDTNSAAFYLRWHLSRLEVASDTLRLTAIASDGTPLDVLEFRDTPPDSADRDGDGLGDFAEQLAGTNPERPDTDGDGLPDGWEFLRGMDPARPSVVPLANGTVGPGDPRLIAEVLAEPIPRPATQLRVHPLPDGRMQLRWLGRVGSRAQIEAAAAPNLPFVPLEEAPASKLAEDRQAIELAGELEARYFRVRLVEE